MYLSHGPLGTLIAEYTVASAAAGKVAALLAEVQSMVKEQRLLLSAGSAAVRPWNWMAL